MLQTYLGVWVSKEKQTAELLARLNIKDGILKQVGDTVDGLDFDVQADVIKELYDTLITI